ncbi:MAG: hypothetical protein COA52_12350 [Hyphomicrobiales bacterium]|nr:MAG: hypothetical protein COA52_12350 [Hyphomicrobiales bacterium]
MIEAALFISLGALSVGLLLFAIIPVVSRRSRSLAIKELERQAPVSFAEITAQKDQMRAHFAVELNRMEKRMNKLQEDTHTHRIDSERWRTHAEHLELDFERLTAEYSELKLRLSTIETELDQQSTIAKDALKTPTGVEKKKFYALETEVAELIAAENAAKLEIVALKSELTSSEGRIIEMEKSMPSLDELDLRKELKGLAEDVSIFIKSTTAQKTSTKKPNGSDDSATALETQSASTDDTENTDAEAPAGAVPEEGQNVVDLSERIRSLKPEAASS